MHTYVSFSDECFMAMVTNHISNTIEHGRVAETRRVIEAQPKLKQFLSGKKSIAALEGWSMRKTLLGPLQLACYHSHARLVALLVKEFGVPVDCIQKHDSGKYAGSWSPLHLAIFEGNQAMVECLLELEADDTLDGEIGGTYFDSALELAEKLDKQDIVQCLKVGGRTSN